MQPYSTTKPALWPNGCARRHQRAPFSVPVKMHHLKAGVTWMSTGMSLDLSEGGLGTLVNGKLRPGETLEIELQLLENDLRLIAIVRHCSDFGCGLEFLGLTPEERMHITDFTTHPGLARTPRLAKLME
jgi:hypothetical protein